MKPEEAVEALRARLDPLPPGLRIEVDDLDHLVVFVRVDLLHLDADALNDRLHAWVARDVRERLPAAEALVEFRNARPASDDDAELDMQAGWRDLEPSFRLDLNQRVGKAELETFAALVPAFLERIRADGRPEGWRDWEMGAAE